MRVGAELMHKFFHSFQLCIETNFGLKDHTFLLEYYDKKTNTSSLDKFSCE